MNSQLTARRLNATLRKLGRRVNAITQDSINYGGCGVYAALVGRAMQRLGVTVGVVVRGYGGQENIRDVRSRITNVDDVCEWNRNGVIFNHVGLEYVIGGRAYHCDSDGTVGADKHCSLDGLYPGRLTVEEAEAIASKQEGWNRTFNRGLIPQIEAAVTEAFAPLQRAA